MPSYFDDYDSETLRALEGEYADAPAPNTRVTLDVGKYEAVVKDVRIVENRNPQRDATPDTIYDHAIVFDLMVLTKGPFEGGMVSKFDPVSKKGMRGLKSDLIGLSRDLINLKTLGEEIERQDMVGDIVQISVTSKTYNGKEYRNIWINRKTGHMPPEDIPGNAHDGFEDIPGPDSSELPWNNQTPGW